ncbi:DUF5998 family protein [Propionicimonas sp.]|uniref:DUF5998 family protein n=1 Tax=Propionicimonas sp. TaxID=1955623 RepID=UPI0039E64855
MTPRPALNLPAGLRAEIHACGYFPELVCDAVSLALGPEEPVAHLVHHEATFNREEIQRHLSVLVLTASRLIVAHTDENEDPGEPAQALTTTESVGLREVNSVALSQVVAHPERYGSRRTEVSEAWLTITWGTMRRIDLEPAHCADPECEADHGLTGMLAGDDLTVRISAAGDGETKVSQLISFASALQLATGSFA